MARRRNEVPSCGTCGYPLKRGRCPNEFCGLTMKQRIELIAKRGR